MNSCPEPNTILAVRRSVLRGKPDLCWQAVESNTPRVWKTRTLPSRERDRTKSQISVENRGLERVKGIEPSYSALKSPDFRSLSGSTSFMDVDHAARPIRIASLQAGLSQMSSKRELHLHRFRTVTGKFER